MTLPDPHPIEATMRCGHLRRKVDEIPAAADWLRNVACLLWDNLPDCEGCRGKGEQRSPMDRFLYGPCPSCHGSGKRDPAEHLRGMIALWTAVVKRAASSETPIADSRSFCQDVLRQVGGTR